MAIKFEQQQQSLIRAGSLPIARASVPVPDMSGLQRFGAALMNAGSEAAAEKKANDKANKVIDDERAGLADGWRFGGIGPDGKYKEEALPDGSPTYRRYRAEGTDSRHASDFRSALSARLNEIQLDDTIPPEEKPERMKAALNGAIEAAPDRLKSSFYDWGTGQLIQRSTTILSEEDRVQQELLTKGLASDIDTDFEQGSSAAAAGLNYDGFIQRIDKNYDLLVGLKRMSPEEAKAGKIKARQGMVANGLGQRVVNLMKEGGFHPDDVENLGLSLENGSDARIELDIPVDEFGRKRPGESYASGDIITKITDEQTRKQLSLNLRQAAADMRQGMASRAKNIEVGATLDRLARFQNQHDTLPSALRDDVELIASNILQGGAHNDPKRRAQLLDLLGRTKIAPKALVGTLTNMIGSGDKDQVDQAVQLYNEVTRLKNQWGTHVGDAIMRDMPEKERDLLEAYRHGAMRGVKTEDMQAGLRKLQGADAPSIADVVRAYDRSKGEGEDAFYKGAHARWRKDFGGFMPLEAEESLKQSYRVAVIVGGDPQLAFDNAYERVRSSYTKSDIYVGGGAMTGGYDLTNPSHHKVQRTTPLGTTAPGAEYEWTENLIRSELARQKIAFGDPAQDPDALTPELLQQMMTPPKFSWMPQSEPDFLGRTMKLEPTGTGSIPEYKIRMFNEGGEFIGYVEKIGPDGSETPLVISPHALRARESQAAAYKEQRESLTTAAEMKIKGVQALIAGRSGKSPYELGDFEEYITTQPPDTEVEYRTQKMQIEESRDKALKRLEEQGGVPPAKPGDQSSLLQPRVGGFDVVKSAVAQVEQVLPDGTGGKFMMRVAAQESDFGQANGTFRVRGDKGVFQVNTTSAFAEVKRRVTEGIGKVAANAQRIKEQIGVDIASVTEADLDKPLVSAVVARLYLTAFDAPIPEDVEDQGAYWKRYYNTEAGAGTVDQFVKSAAKVPDDFSIEPASYSPAEVKGSGKVSLRYANQGAERSLPVTKNLEAKLTSSVEAVFGEGYTVEVFSGGQGKGSRGRTGTRRHNDEGKGGRAADVYVYSPAGKRVQDPERLMKLRRYWLANGYGSVGHFMAGHGMHFDEITKDELRKGESLAWQY